MKKNKETIFLIIAILGLILFGTALAPIGLQNDTFYTIAIGQYIMENGISEYDPFSWHEALPYTFPHWLYDVTIGAIYNVGGMFGIYLSTVGLTVALGIVWFLVNCKLHKNKLTSFILAMALIYLMSPYIAARAQLVTFILEGLQARYPFLNGGSIGRSVMGKSIPYLRIGRGEAEVFYNASHHANEWLTTPVLLKFLEEYSESYATNGTIFNVSASELYNKATLYLVPIVNPDGVDLVNGVVPSGRYLTQARRLADNYPNIPYPNGWKANINGVDLNLQYPANWERAREIKFSQGFTIPGPRDYVGSAPLSEPESRAVYDFTRNHNFRLTLSYHSQGEIIYWKYLDYEPENSRRIAEYFGEVSGYAVEETPYASGFAGYKDWLLKPITDLATQ